MISGIQDRFDQPGYKLCQNLEELFIKAADYSTELQHVVSFYGDDLVESELSTQLEIFCGCFSGTVILKYTLSFLRDLSGALRTFYKHVCQIARLLLVAASERSF